MGAVVPLPRNQQENDDLYELWATYVPIERRMYLALGMNDINNEGQWQDLADNPVTYFNWRPDQPDQWGGNEDYAIMLGNRFRGASMWADYGRNVVDVLCQLPCSTLDDIVLECSPTNIALSIPKCFLDDKKIDSSAVYIGQNTAESSGDGDACQG